MYKSLFDSKILTSILFLSILISCQKNLPENVELAYHKLPAKVDFNIDVKPILSDKCFSCHGPDAVPRKANLRFDIEGGLFKKSSNGNFAFMPGSLNKSEAIKRILSDDLNYRMPPLESHLTLSAREKAIFVKWVEQDAEWKKHWAFISPTKAHPPKIDKDWILKNEIDLFVYAKLIKNSLSPAANTTKEQLLRRVTIDLTGMVPTLSELNFFLNDKSTDAYEKVVNRLLKSDAHAERLAIEWMDLARYSDSHGYHSDGSRHMWPWRDWVIKAFKENMPYNDFVTEQIAGDLLPNATKEQILATAFNRNHPTTSEGGAIEEEFRVDYVTNRTNTFGTAFLGMTMECAKCHDHKYDPISQKNYYQLFAFFNNVKELGLSANDKNTGPFLLLTDSITDKKMSRLNTEIESLEQIENREKKNFINDANFKTSNKYKRISPVVHLSFEKIGGYSGGGDDWRQGYNKKDRILDNNKKTTLSEGVELVNGMLGLAAKFDDQYDQITIYKIKGFEVADPFSISVWVLPEQKVSKGKTMTIIGNSSIKDQFWRGWDLVIESTGQVSSRLVSSLPGNYIHTMTNDSIPIGKWTHLLMTYDGSTKASGLKIYINGQTTDTEIMYDRLYKSVVPELSIYKNATVVSKKSLDILILGKSPRVQTGDNGIFLGMLDQLSIFDSEILPLQVHQIQELSHTKVPYMWKPNEDRFLSLSSQLYDLRMERLSTIDTVQEIMVMEEMPQQRNTFILERGAYDTHGEQVKRSTPENIMAFSAKYPKDRLGLSQWLFNEKNPLTARVAVNRYWQMIYGTGLVASANDFGNQGSLPSHPQLLDWLAVDFMESGWDLKKLLKKMVTSNVYRQTSIANPELREIDPENRLLARGPSYRLQAEFIRNNALKSSGLLYEKLGGESAKPYQPKGLWIEKGAFSFDLKYYKQNHDNNQYRNSLYTFIKRTSPPPYMTTFDMPGRDFCIVSRERTNTPLQALSLLNDPQFVEASKALAVRMKKEGGDSLRGQIEIGFQLAISRKPNTAELSILTDLYSQELEVFQKNKDSALAYLSVGDYQVPKKIDVSELAAMTVIANTLFNLDEMYTKR